MLDNKQEDRNAQPQAEMIELCEEELDQVVGGVGVPKSAEADFLAPTTEVGKALLKILEENLKTLETEM